MRKQLIVAGILLTALSLTFLKVNAQSLGARLVSSSIFTDTSNLSNVTSYIMSDSTRYSYPSINTDKCSQRYRYYRGPYSRPFETRTLLAYSASGNLSEEMLLEKLSNGSEDTFNYTSYAYNIAGSLISYESRYKEKATGRWFNSVKYSFTRDVKNSITDSIYQHGDADSNWVMQNAKRCSYMRDSSGRVLRQVLSTFDNKIGWYQDLNDDTTDFVYDSYGTLAQQTIHSWCPNILPTRFTYQWNSAGKMSVQYFEQYVPSLGWVPAEKVMFEYDTASNNTQRLHYYWLQTVVGQNVGVYYPHHKDSIAYNSFHQPTFQAYLSSVNYSDSSWQIVNNYYRYHYETYTPITTSSEILQHEISSSDVTVAPNPANKVLQIAIHWNVLQVSNCTVIDVAGHLYKRISLPMAKDLHFETEVSDLPSGSYFLIIKGAGNGVEISKKVSILH